MGLSIKDLFSLMAWPELSQFWVPCMNLRMEKATHYFMEVEFTSDLCSWWPRQYYRPLTMMRRPVSSFLGKVSMEQKQSPLGLICEGNFKVLFPKRAGKDIIRY